MVETIPTLLCINASYTQHAAVCLVSALENNPDFVFDVAIVTTQPLGAGEERLYSTLKPYTNCRARVILLDSATRHLPVKALHYTIDTYSRLWVADFFPENVNKVLYLDSDMVVVGSIKELWQTDISDHVVAAVTIPGSTRCAPYGIPESSGYFQSGVLVINLARWRSEHVLDRMIDWIGEHGHTIQDADQDVLNACLHDRRRPLPFFWNVIAPFYFDQHPLRISEEERAGVRRDARIIHYNGPSKPWHYLSRHPRRADYWKYLRLTEWRDYRPGDKTLLNWGKKHFGPMVPEAMRSYLKRTLLKAG
jgi:lipopolysaccharide biosynthesis glycosyltransferase